MSPQTAPAINPVRPTQPVRRRRKKPAVLFVDDEQRVLNSMRALFRREYDVHVTTVGSEAIQLLRDNTIDVIVCDQRMPEMTGVEVLGGAKEVSPGTVRILLTGYADLDAIEGSINVGEVFRFLSKPCPPNHLRETVKLAVEIAKTTRLEEEKAAQQAEPQVKLAAAKSPAEPAVEPAVEIVTDDDVIVVPEELGLVLEEDGDAASLEIEFDSAEATAESETLNADDLAAAAESGGEEIVLGGDLFDGDEAGFDGNVTIASDVGLNSAVAAVGVVVFSSSDGFSESAGEMLGTEHQVISAKTLVQVTEILAKGQAGVLVTDFVTEGRVLRKMIATLKRYLPELITIVISDDRDASEMISLINHGQVFRYMSKPAQRDRFTQNVNAAVLKHIQLRENPELLSRYQVEDDGSGHNIPQVFGQLMGKIKSVRKLWQRTGEF